jgi:hypothetical protein
VRLSDDLRRISIFGVGPASRELAVAVARALGDVDLRIFDVDYQFDVQLPKGAPPEELRRKIESLAR